MRRADATGICVAHVRPASAPGICTRRCDRLKQNRTEQKTDVQTTERTSVVIKILRSVRAHAGGNFMPKSAKAVAAAEMGERLYRLLAGERFLCDTCHEYHALAEHRDCREQLVRKNAERARQALTDALGETS